MVDMSAQELDRLDLSIFTQDFSVGTEKFRDELLARCLEIINENECRELEDEELEMLAAAGSPVIAEYGFDNPENKGIF